MGIDRQGEDDTGPGAADSLRSAPPGIPDIPNGPVASPAAHDSAGFQMRAEHFRCLAGFAHRLKGKDAIRYTFR